MFETLLRPQEVHQLPPPPSIDEARERLKQLEHKRELKRHRQMTQAKEQAASTKRKREGEEELHELGADAESSHSKRAKTESTEEEKAMTVGATTSTEQAPTLDRINLSKTMQEVRGHTSYLTFACLLPTIDANDSRADEERGMIEDPDSSNQNADL